MAGEVTRAEVAAAAGTSTAVVSYVLNDGPRPVAPATRRRVLDAVERLGYRPNTLAAGLSARRTNLVGLVVPDLTVPFFAEMATALAAAARREGLMLLLASSAWDPDLEATWVDEYVGLRVRGVCLAPAGVAPSGLRTLTESRTRLVLMSGDRGASTAPLVVSDAVEAGRLATRHLLDHGFADVACLTVAMDGAPVARRVDGWRAARRDAGLDGPGTLLRTGVDRYGADEVAGEFLATQPGPVAVMATTDELALGLLAAAARLGRRVPEDCAVVGCDGIGEGRLARPPLTTVAEPVETLCATAVGCLLAGDPVEDSPAPAAVSLRLGGTCGTHA